ncbi:MAG: hypothetical protein EOO29_52560 [Comamonadaceae bacterium]|nr:MAG: hypothetical protein EOO29_52560 [Comamonadaceae bacterium]
MLSIQKKADILRKACLAPPLPGLETDEPSVGAWAREVELRFVAYSAARAAQSLRHAEEARQHDRLRSMAWSTGGR